MHTTLAVSMALAAIVSLSDFSCKTTAPPDPDPEPSPASSTDSPPGASLPDPDSQDILVSATRIPYHAS